MPIPREKNDYHPSMTDEEMHQSAVDRIGGEFPVLVYDNIEDALADRNGRWSAPPVTRPRRRKKK